jgi:hypothetical protein
MGPIHSPSFGAGCTSSAYLTAVFSERTTLRAVARDPRNARDISAIARAAEGVDLYDLLG